MNNKDKDKALELREKLAELAHSQWSGWMKYLFGKCHKFSNGKMVIPKWAVERWSWQMIASYEELSKTEKDSDRTEADKFLALLCQPTVDKLKAEKPVCSLCGEPITEEYGPVSCHQSCVNGVVNAEEKPPESPSPVEGQDVGGNTSIEKIMSNILDIIIGLNVLNHYTDGSHKVKDYHAESLITELNNNWVYLQSQITGLQERVKELEATLQDGIDLYYSDVEGEYGWGLLGKWAGIVKRVLKNNPEKGDVRDG